jgi:sulfhydrogenase subunit gamma (sulfur reductase)
MTTMQAAVADMPVVDYSPQRMRVEAITDESPGTKTFRLVFTDPDEAAAFTFRAGQFGLYSVAGYGEAVLCIASSPTRDGYIECSVKRAGKVTTALHELNEGAMVGFRGPYGNHFPIDEMEGHPIVFVAGGIGLAPVRSVIWNVLDQRDRFGDITIVYGARSVSDLVYKRELEAWQARDDVTTVCAVDPGGETDDWDGAVGFVPTVLKEAAPQADEAFAVMCGPPIMIRFTLPVLLELGFPKERVYTTLENRMKCGVGKCGRCNVGSLYVCKDGPVFTAAQIDSMPADM